MKHKFKMALAFSAILNCELALSQDHSVQPNLTISEEFLSAMARQQRDPLSIYRPDQQPAILGRMTLRSVSFLIQQNELALYELFNKLNSSDDLDINCEQARIQRLGEFAVPHAACEPVFMERLRTEHEEYLAGEANKIPRALSWLIKPRRLSELELRDNASALFDKLDDEMSKLANEDEQFEDLLVRLDVLNVEYEKMMAIAVDRSKRSLPVSSLRGPDFSQPPIEDPTAGVRVRW